MRHAGAQRVCYGDKPLKEKALRFNNSFLTLGEGPNGVGAAFPGIVSADIAVAWMEDRVHSAKYCDEDGYDYDRNPECGGQTGSDG